MIDSCCHAATPATRDLAQLLAFGALMSAGHCLGMCGPLVCAVSAPRQGEERDFGELARTTGVYHAGRIASYAVIGLALGALGGLAPDRATALVGQASLSLLAAAALVFVGLGLLGVFPLAKLSCTAGLSRWITTRVGGLLAARSMAKRFALGAANGLLPCGPVYTVAVTALAAGSALNGALSMVAFGVGTVPVLAALAFGMRWTSERLRVSLYRAGAVLALGMGAQLALRGLAALDVVPHARIQEFVLW